MVKQNRREIMVIGGSGSIKKYFYDVTHATFQRFFIEDKDYGCQCCQVLCFAK